MTLQVPLFQVPHPKRCAICQEIFAEEWMAARCAAQGAPPPLYRRFDILAFRSSKLAICTGVCTHHAIGVKCHVEGPCPHDISYHGYPLKPDYAGVERTWGVTTPPAKAGGFSGNA